MDETSIKLGRARPGKMKPAYFWQVYGEEDEICFLYYAQPVLNRFFNWIDEQFYKHGFLPSSPFLGALSYIRERRVGLSVYLDDPDVAIDTNHLKRALGVIPMKKKNWLFFGQSLAPNTSVLCKV